MDNFAIWIGANEWIVPAAAGGAVVVAVLLTAMRWRHIAQPVKPPLATIEERISFTAVGIVSLLLLILHNAAVVIWLAKSTTVIHEAAIGTMWIGGNVLWGLGVALGRRRTYRIDRASDRE